MSKSMVVGSGSNVTFGLLKDLMEQLEAGEKSGGEKGITGAQLRAFLEHRNPFDSEQLKKVLPYADEEVKSDYGYPADFRIRSPEEQVGVWKEYFPDLDTSQVLALTDNPLPEGAEGWGIIPKFSQVGSTYHQALEKMLSLLAEQRSLYNWRKGRLGPEHLRLIDETQQALSQMEEKTPGDFLVLPFQFGLRHRGRSARRARICFLEAEFGLGPYEGAALLTTHPDRITGSGQLYMDCAGCEYGPPDAGGRFGHCLSFFWHDEKLNLHDAPMGNTYQYYGAASAFRSE